jgi:methionyl-tRNA formyltransferase
MSSDVTRRVVFAGTPSFAVPALLALHQHPRAAIVAVYTQPDRGTGRGQRVAPSAVKGCALEHGLPVQQPTDWKRDETLRDFSALCPDLLVVVAYGVILPAAALAVPRADAINVHASLLPRWRGAAPIQRAIMAGDSETGICLMRIVPALDAGPVFARAPCRIESDDTAATLEARLARLGAEMLARDLDALMARHITPVEQDPRGVTYAAKITRDDRDLDWRHGADELARQVRALNPAPLACTEALGIPVNVLAADVVRVPLRPGRPGEVLSADRDGIVLATAHDALRVTLLQPPGKRPMTAADFVNGYKWRIPGSCS